MNSNHILFAYCLGAPDTTAGVYAHGCINIQRDSGTGSAAIYQNIGSSAVPSWSLLDTAASSFTLPAAATDATTTTTTSFGLTQNTVTTGNGISQSVNALTTGKGYTIASSATAITGAGRMFLVNHTGATSTSGTIFEVASAANDETVIAQVTASAANAAGVALNVSSATTTGIGVAIGLTAATTGSSLAVTDSSADTGTRPTVLVNVSNAAATGATPLSLINASSGAVIKIAAALQSTHFRKILQTNTATLWVSDGTTANGNLSGTAGDIVFNGGSNKPEYCTGTTNWTALV